MSLATVQATAFEADFERFEKGVGAAASPWLKSLRRDAIQEFARQGIPAADDFRLADLVLHVRGGTDEQVGEPGLAEGVAEA